MSIEFSCPACGQQYRVKDEFAGRSTKCAKCQGPVSVPEPPQLEPADDLSGLLDEDLGPALTAPKKSPSPTPAPGGKTCPSCNAPLPDAAVICVQCGYDLIEKKKRVTQSTSATKKAKRPASEMMLLARGTAVSALGALLGAIVWAVVAVLTHREIGWIAWAVGAAAGGGMSLGYHDKSDGTVPGIIAAVMALGGITLGKLFILIWMIMPLIANRPQDFQFKRELVAGQMANDALKKRGIDPAKADRSKFDQEYETAMKAIRNLPDEEISRRFDEKMAQMESEINQKVAQAQVAANAAEGEGGEVAGGPPQAALEIDDDDDEAAPSLIGAFFKTMFGPMDALFILLAFFSAYKIGSGTSSE